MKIALAQLNYTIGDIDANVSKIINAIRKAEAEGADAVSLINTITAMRIDINTRRPVQIGRAHV